MDIKDIYTLDDIEQAKKLLYWFEEGWHNGYHNALEEMDKVYRTQPATASDGAKQPAAQNPVANMRDQEQGREPYWTPPKMMISDDGKILGKE